ncbi:MAG: serine hydrolase [Dehalococcoidia bacterium]
MKIILGTLAVIALGAMIAVALLANLGAEAAPAVPRLTPTRTATPRVSPTPRATPTPPIKPVAAQGPGIMVAECTGTGVNSVRVFFLWNPSRAGRQFLDLSMLNNGFAPGSFFAAGPLPSDRWGFVWEGLRQGSTHYARINTLTSDGWKATPPLAFYTPICDPAAHTPAAGPDMLSLRADIEAAIVRSGINTAVAITDLRTGESIDVNGANNRLPGCTINLFVLMRVAVDLQNGRYPEPVPGDLIGQTINRSDPITSRTLMKNYIGAGDLYRGINEVNTFMQSLGMRDTLMDHPPAFFHESVFGRSIDNRITALDTNRGLQALWDGRVLTPGWRDYMLRKMTLVKPGLNYLIPAGTSSGAVVSHKNGFLYAEGWADNDIGIVWFERNGQRYGYAISFFTQHVPSKYADIPMGQQVSSLAYQWFVGRYGYP